MNSNKMTNYLLKPRNKPKWRFAYIGIPHDAATTLGNPGARFAPQQVRQCLKGIFDWRLQDYQLVDIEKGLLIDFSSTEIADYGDISLSYYDTEKTVDETSQAVLTNLKSGYIPLIVGGDHGITYPCVKALHDSCAGSIGLIQLDAHCDLMDYSKRQGRHSGSSGMRRSLALERLAGPNLVQVGLRGYTTVEQYQMGEQYGLRRISASQFTEMGAYEAAKQALEWSKDGTEAVYLTIDMDVITPGEAPGTGWPEPGGITGQAVMDFVRTVAPDIAAIDIAELNPLCDSRTNTTSILAARLLMDFITARV
jgi:formiminoglutamase/agmatinase